MYIYIHYRLNKKRNKFFGLNLHNIPFSVRINFNKSINNINNGKRP